MQDDLNLSDSDGLKSQNAEVENSDMLHHEQSEESSFGGFQGKWTYEKCMRTRAKGRRMHKLVLLLSVFLIFGIIVAFSVVMFSREGSLETPLPNTDEYLTQPAENGGVLKTEIQENTEAVGRGTQEVTEPAPNTTDVSFFTVDVISSGNASPPKKLDIDELKAEIAPSMVDLQISQNNYITYANGIIISSSGYVLADYSSLCDASWMRAILFDGSECDVYMVGFDKQQGIAVLKMAGENFKVMPMTSSSELQNDSDAGVLLRPEAKQDPVYLEALLDFFSTESGKQGDLQISSDVVYTDACFSGCPVVDANGKAVAMMVQNDASEPNGTGTALLLDNLMPYVNQIILNEQTECHQYSNIAVEIFGFIGIDLSEEEVKLYRLPYGVYVSSVNPDSNAYSAGLRSNDIIVGLNQAPIICVGDLIKYETYCPPEGTITITVYRGCSYLNIIFRTDACETDA